MDGFGEEAGVGMGVELAEEEAELAGGWSVAFFGEGEGEPGIEGFRVEGDGVAEREKGVGLVDLGEEQGSGGGDFEHANVRGDGRCFAV